MKIRNGFVSNSSSSSFIVLGVKRKGDYDEIMENENFSDKDIYSLYIEEKDFDYVTGFVIADFSDDGDYLKDQSFSFSELQEKAQKVADALGVDISEVNLYTGTRPC